MKIGDRVRVREAHEDAKGRRFYREYEGEIVWIGRRRWMLAEYRRGKARLRGGFFPGDVKAEDEKEETACGTISER